MHITVLIPAFNESIKIADTIDSIKDIEYINNIIVIDDGSTDNTFAIAMKKGVKTIRLDKNMGKGYALNMGLKNTSSDIIVLLDADVGITGNEIIKIVHPVINGECDVAIASFKESKTKGGFGIVKSCARYGTWLLTGVLIQSVLSGQRALTSKAITKLSFERGYGAEVGMTIDLIRNGFKIKEYEVNMTHNETGRNLQGFVHRGKQMLNIAQVLIKKAIWR